MALTQINSSENYDYSENVGPVIITYSANRKTGEDLTKIHAEVSLNGVSVGTATIYKSGKKDYYLNEILSSQASIDVFQAIVNSSQEIFENLNKTE